MSTRLQSVLTSQLSQNSALPVSVPVSAPVPLQVANQGSAQAEELAQANSAFSQQTLISLEGIAKGNTYVYRGVGYKIQIVFVYKVHDRSPCIKFCQNFSSFQAQVRKD